MARPLPWSPSSLDTFKNCPRQYQEKYILKTMPPEPQGEAQAFGEWVHKQFQERLERSTPLPAELAIHEDYMQLLRSKSDSFFCEQKIGLDRQARPCSWEHKRDIWFRGIIDFNGLDRNKGVATIADYKTGKPHNKFAQLAVYAIWVFTMYPMINLINAQFYWTRDQSVTKKVWGRDEIDALWMLVVPDLNQYAEAFKTDVWQARPSGLCNGWCPLTTCQHWKPKRVY